MLEASGCVICGCAAGGSCFLAFTNTPHTLPTAAMASCGVCCVRRRVCSQTPTSTWAATRWTTSAGRYVGGGQRAGTGLWTARGAGRLCTAFGALLSFPISTGLRTLRAGPPVLPPSPSQLPAGSPGSLTCSSFLSRLCYPLLPPHHFSLAFPAVQPRGAAVHGGARLWRQVQPAGGLLHGAGGWRVVAVWLV